MIKKQIYLTIDDAPSEVFAEKVDFLSKKRIPAIFFCIGEQLEKKEEEVIHAIKKGFIIGNHSYNHSGFSRISLAEAKRQIHSTEKIIDGIYKKAQIRRPMKVFRFPYGDKGGKNKEGIQKYLKQSGFKQPKFKGITYRFFRENKLGKEFDVFWTFDFEEYAFRREDVLKKSEDKTPKQGGTLANVESKDIVLIHDHLETNKLFFEIIRALIKRKVVFEKFEKP